VDAEEAIEKKKERKLRLEGTNQNKRQNEKCLAFYHPWPSYFSTGPPL
jgi:hypothetical protein